MSYISSNELPKPGNKPQQDLYTIIANFITEVKKIVNGGITFNDNHDAKMVTFTSSGTPDVENTVPHSLGKIPSGYLVYSRDKAATLYDGATAWTKTDIYLKANVATTVFKIIIF